MQTAPRAPRPIPAGQREQNCRRSFLQGGGGRLDQSDGTDRLREPVKPLNELSTGWDVGFVR